MARKLQDRIPQYIVDVKPYPPGKPIEETERELGISDVIKMASNESPFGPSPKAIEAIRDSLSKLHRYPDGASYYLRQALSEKLGVASNRFFFGAGSNEAIDQLLKVFGGPGKKTAFCWPSFAVYPIITQAIGGQSIMVPVKDMAYDLPALAAAIDDTVSVIFIANPNNPTGSAVGKKEFEDFMDRVPEDAIVALDEAYIDYAESDTPNGLDYIDRYENLVLLRTFSKAYGLAGVRVGYAIGAPTVIGTLEKVRQPFNMTVPGQAGALAALADEEYLQKVISGNREGLEFLYEQFDRLGVRYWSSQANFVLFETDITAAALADRMLRAGVIVRSMAAFGLENHLRITVGLPAENRRFIDSLEKELATGV